MSDLKKFQEAQLRALPVEGEITSSFPPYWIYTLSGRDFMRGNLLIGLAGVIGSTGSRIYYEDYSGSIGIDQTLRFTTLGVHIGIWDELKEQKLYFTVDLNPGVTYTSMKFRSFQSLGSYGLSEATEELWSLNVALQPTFTITRRFGRFALNCFAGYHLTVLSGKLKSKENKDAYLVADGDAVKADWSGLRVGVNVTLFLK